MTSKARELADLLDPNGNIKAKSGRTTHGRNLTNDGTKLDGIEANATADQTHSEIRALIVAGNDTNVFTDADHSKLDGIEAGATADQTKADIDALNIDADTLDGKQLATIESEYQSYADTAAANVVDSAPSALNTLNELAAALGDDANFATTTATSLGEKLPKSGGQMTGNITMSGSQTVDGRDLSVDGAKLDGIEAGATADQSAAEIRALVESASDSNVFTDADHSKLNGIEANAKNDQTITAGGGLTGGGTGDVTISHSDTSSVSSTDNSGNTFVQDLTFDTYGHVTAVGTGSVSVGNGTLTVQGTGALGGSGTFTANQSGNTTISISHDDTSSQASVNGSGRTYVQDVTLDAYGHVTGLATATETVVNTDTNTTDWRVQNSGGTQQFAVSAAEGVRFAGSGATSVSFDASTQKITISSTDTNTDTNTTYSAGSGLSLSGTTFSHSDTSSQASVNGSGRTYIQDITLDTYGHVTGLATATETVVNTDTNTNQLTTFQVEDGDGTEVTISHGKEWKFVEAGGININWTDTSTGSDGDPFDLSFNVSTSITAGGGLTGGGALSSNRTISHADTSSQGSVNNSDDTVIQDITLDTYGHVTGIGSKNLDDIFLRKSATSGLDMNNNNITDVEDIYLQDRIYHDGDTDTYMQFHSENQWRVVVGGSERLEVKNSSPHVLVSGDLNSTSDERLKKNIKPIDNALADICQLEGVTFDWKDTGTQGQGFIAQQVEPIIPDVVNTDEDTGMKSINYVGLIGHLVEAIKTQQTQIDDLKAEIQSMKSY